MKKLIAVLTVLLILAGCKSPDADDTDVFARDYDTEEGISRHLDGADDIMEKLTNGTHVVLFAHPDEDDKPIVQNLAKKVKEYSGMVIYYSDITDVDTKMADEIQNKMTPWVSVRYFEGGKPVIFLIGNGELVDCIYSYDSSEYVNSINDALKIMDDNKKPACIDGC